MNGELFHLAAFPSFMDQSLVQGGRVICWGNLRERETTWEPRLRWEDNIKMDLQEVGCWGMDWILLVQDRDRWRAHVNTVMNPRVP
jgi:hypothetical protein